MCIVSIIKDNMIDLLQVFGQVDWQVQPSCLFYFLWAQTPKRLRKPDTKWNFRNEALFCKPYVRFPLTQGSRQQPIQNIAIKCPNDIFQVHLSHTKRPHGLPVYQRCTNLSALKTQSIILYMVYLCAEKQRTFCQSVALTTQKQ